MTAPSPFLKLPPDAWLASNDLAFAVRDGFPVAPGHALVLTKRLVPTWFDATPAEQSAMMALVNDVRTHLMRTLRPVPDGFNVGFNAGSAAGQTVPHVHILRLQANAMATAFLPPLARAAIRCHHRVGQRCERCTDVDTVRGMEGAASARYYAAWARFLPYAFPFERRSRRPPHNPVNACISFAATMLHHEMVAAIAGLGLDPALGCLHTIEDGRWSLSLDLLEPFRPVLVEALTLDMFSRGMLAHSHFEPKEGGVYLTRDGRAKLILQYERRMERQFLSEHTGQRTTLRAQIYEQARMFKSALDTPENFTPFRMN